MIPAFLFTETDAFKTLMILTSYNSNNFPYYVMNKILILVDFRDDHQFSPLHWAAKGGHLKILEMLISRGARVHTTNMGDDTPLHLACAHGHRQSCHKYNISY